MDLTLTVEQEEIQRAIRLIVDRRKATGPLSIRELDQMVLAQIVEAGYADVVTGGGSILDAVLVLEAAHGEGVCAPLGARTLVAPMLGLEDAPDLLSLAVAGTVSRFPDVDAFLVHHRGGGAALVPADQVRVEPASTRWGYPVGRVLVDAGVGNEVDPTTLVRAWRIALAAEAGALMGGAVRIASAHVTDRVQFGRPIGGYQAVQHRLARAYVVAEGTKWLARQAACSPDDDELAAAAATFATLGAREVVANTQQVCGAIGITDEFDLTRFTAPLVFLQAELGGAAAHGRDYARLRFAAPRRPAPGRRRRTSSPAFAGASS